MEPTSSDSAPGQFVTFENLSTSSTMVYRFAPDVYRELVSMMDRRAPLAPLTASVAEDFEMTRSSVLDDIAVRSVSRRRLTASVSVDAQHPMFAGVADDIALVVSVSGKECTIATTINLYLDAAGPDQLIAIAHSMYGRPGNAPMRLRLENAQGTAVQTIDCQSIKQAQSALADFLSIKGRSTSESHFRCVEIRQVGETRSAKEVLDLYPQPMYGVLTADEGWRHVGRGFAETRLTDAWGTREFVRVVSVGETSVMLNFRPDSYGESQNAYFRRHFDHVEPYFSHRYRLAGLEHGQFFAMELYAYRKCVADDLQHRLEERRTLKISVSPFGNIREQTRRHSLYRSLVEDMARLRDHPPTELGALVDMIENDSGLPKRLADLRQEVEALEAEEQTIYLYRVNSLLVVVAWIGVAVAIIGLAAAVAFH